MSSYFLISDCNVLCDICENVCDYCHKDKLYVVRKFIAPNIDCVIDWFIEHLDKFCGPYKRYALFWYTFIDKYNIVNGVINKKSHHGVPTSSWIEYEQIGSKMETIKNWCRYHRSEVKEFLTSYPSHDWRWDSLEGWLCLIQYESHINPDKINHGGYPGHVQIDDHNNLFGLLLSCGIMSMDIVDYTNLLKPTMKYAGKLT